MNNEERQELKDLIREVIREELKNCSVQWRELKAHEIQKLNTQSVSVYACPIIDETPSNVKYTTNTNEDTWFHPFKD